MRKVVSGVVAVMFMGSAVSAAVGSIAGKTLYQTLSQNPSLVSNLKVTESFHDAVDGPQEPGTIDTVGDRTILTYTSCQAHMCSDNHNLMLVDADTNAVYIENWSMGSLANAAGDKELGALAKQTCVDGECDWSSASLSVVGLDGDDREPYANAVGCAFMRGDEVVFHTSDTRHDGVMRINRTAQKMTTAGQQNLIYRNGNTLVRIEPLGALKPKPYGIRERNVILHVTQGGITTSVPALQTCSN